MSRTQRQWVYRPRPASHVPDQIKEQVTAKADEIIETVFKPQYIKPPREMRFQYVFNPYTKWYSNRSVLRTRFYMGE